MPRVKCPKCNKTETILKSGFIRNKQRFVCKECNFNFTLNHIPRKSNSGNTKTHQITLLDIAKTIGVSTSTVSRALHDHPDISIKIRESVKLLAQNLNYQPNALAQSLANRRTNTIGVIIPDIERPFFASVVSGIQHKATECGYKVIICQSNESHNTEVINLQMLMSNMVDGLLICHSKETKNFDHLKLYAKRGVPIVHFDRVCNEMDTSKILVEDKDGAYCITNHLIDQGYKNIAFLGGPMHLEITQLRLEGYLNSLKENHYPLIKQHIAYSDFSKESTTTIINSWLKLKTKPDAIFSIFNKGAIDSIQYLKYLKFKIPKQIGVAAFGNDPTSEIIEPCLTVFDQQPFKIGMEAVQQFLNQVMQGINFKPSITIIKGGLIIRNSTKR